MVECSDPSQIFHSVNTELLNPLRDLCLHTEDQDLQYIVILKEMLLCLIN